MIVLGVETFATHLFCTATHSYSRGVMATLVLAGPFQLLPK